MRIIKKITQKGFSLVEMIFYIALFTIITIVVVNALISMTKSFRETSIQADLVGSSSVMERITREVRQAYNISSISTSDATLQTTDESDNNKTIRFLLSGTNVQIFENDVLIGNLNSPSIRVTSLSFTQITTSHSKAIKISMSVISNKDASNRVENFYDTVVLRGSY